MEVFQNFRQQEKNPTRYAPLAPRRFASLRSFLKEILLQGRFTVFDFLSMHGSFCLDDGCSDIPVAKKSSFGRSRVSKGRVAGGPGYPSYPPGYLGGVTG